MTAQSLYFESDGLRLHCLADGDGPLDVVLVHGIASCAPAWGFVAHEMAALGGIRVLTVDVRGRGRSEPAGRGEYTLDDYARDMFALVDGVGLDRPVVVGHSMGARIAATFGACYPEATGPLAIIEPPLSGPGRRPYPLPLAPYLEALHKAKEGATADDMRAQFPTWTEEQLEVRAKWLGACDETALVESYANFHLEDFFVAWTALTARTWFIYGDESPVVPASALEEVMATLPAATVTKVPKAGHMIPWDNLDGFVAAVTPLLKEATRDKASGSTE
jgi:N-formylmaleamate deformylase